MLSELKGDLPYGQTLRGDQQLQLNYACFDNQYVSILLKDYKIGLFFVPENETKTSRFRGTSGSSAIKSTMIDSGSVSRIPHIIFSIDFSFFFALRLETSYKHTSMGATSFTECKSLSIAYNKVFRSQQKISILTILYIECRQWRALAFQRKR